MAWSDVEAADGRFPAKVSRREWWPMTTVGGDVRYPAGERRERRCALFEEAEREASVMTAFLC